MFVVMRRLLSMVFCFIALMALTVVTDASAFGVGDFVNKPLVVFDDHVEYIVETPVADVCGVMFDLDDFSFAVPVEISRLTPMISQVYFK